MILSSALASPFSIYVHFVLGNLHEIFAIWRLTVHLGGLDKRLPAYPVIIQCDLFDDCDGRTLEPLHTSHELRRLEKRLGGAGVNPRIAPPQCHDIEGPFLQVHLI